MSNKIYQIGGDHTPIHMTVFGIVTHGIVGSIIVNYPPGDPLDLPVEPNGCISRSIIGYANELNYTRVEVITTIDLKIINPANWKAEFNNLSIKYTLEGGTDGTQHFENENDDKQHSGNGRIITVNKIFDLEKP